MKKKLIIRGRVFSVKHNPHWLVGFRRSWYQRRRWLAGRTVEAAGGQGRELTIGPLAFRTVKEKPKRIKDQSGGSQRRDRIRRRKRVRGE